MLNKIHQVSDQNMTLIRPVQGYNKAPSPDEGGGELERFKKKTTLTCWQVRRWRESGDEYTPFISLKTTPLYVSGLFLSSSS